MIAPMSTFVSNMMNSAVTEPSSLTLSTNE